MKMEDTESNDVNVEFESVSKKQRLNHPGGAPRSSWVWHYFDFNKETESSVCKLCTSTTTKLMGKNPGTLCKHLFGRHKDRQKEFNELKEAANEKKTEESNGQQHQPTIEELLTRNEKSRKQLEKYHKEHPKQIEFTQRLAIFMAGTSVPWSVVEYSAFVSLIDCLDTKVQIPKRKRLAEEIHALSSQLDVCLKKLFDESSRVSFCADIWSRAGYSASYLGVTAHFFDHSKKVLRHVFVALKPLEGSHTSILIADAFDEVLREWDLSINDPKVFKILTDNGANIVKAFRNIDDFITDRPLQQAEEEEEEGEDIYAQFGFKMEVEPVNETDADVQEFDQYENQIAILIGGQKRLSCIDHQLACLIKSTVDQNASAKSLIRKAYLIASKIRHSVRATEYVLKSMGKKVLLPVPTHWIVNFYVLDRLYELKDSINSVCEDLLEIDSLTTAEWSKAKALCDFLSPFATTIMELAGEKYVTISRIIPALAELKEVMIEFSQRAAYFRDLSADVVEKLNKRFAFLLDPINEAFNPTYALSTFIDPQFSWILDLPAFHQLKQEAENELLRLFNDEANENHGNGAPNDTSLEVGQRYSHLFAQYENSRQRKETNKLSNAASSLKWYNENRSNVRNVDSFSFWTSRASIHPSLARLACDILAIPATNAPVERIFSKCGVCCNGRKAAITDENLSRELKVRVNLNLRQE